MAWLGFGISGSPSFSRDSTLGMCTLQVVCARRMLAHVLCPWRSPKDGASPAVAAWPTQWSHMSVSYWVRRSAMGLVCQVRPLS